RRRAATATSPPSTSTSRPPERRPPGFRSELQGSSKGPRSVPPDAPSVHPGPPKGPRPHETPSTGPVRPHPRPPARRLRRPAPRLGQAPHAGAAWAKAALDPLVKNGTITQAGEDAVLAALTAARPDHGPGHGPGRGGPGFGNLDAAAKALGMTADEQALPAL